MSPTTVKMQYEVYRRKGLSDEEFHGIDAFFKQIENEDKGLSNGAQRNLNSDTYVHGPLHPHNEKGVIYFKGLVKDALQRHALEEQELGRHIGSIRRSTDSGPVKADEAFCRAVCDQTALVEW